VSNLTVPVNPAISTCKIAYHCHRCLQMRNRQESRAIAKMTARCALYISGSNELLRRYGHSKLSKMAACRQLGFDVTRNSGIRSAVPENPTLEPNMKWIGSPVAEIWPFVCWRHMEPHFGGRGGRRGQRWHHSKEWWWFHICSPLWPLRYL